MIPISRTRSNTDIAIVFVTPIPPMISASSEKIQPAEMISRLEVSTLTAWPGSTIALIPGNRDSSRFATAFGVSPSSTITASVVTSCGRCAICCTTFSGRTIPRSTKALPLWKIPATRNRRFPDVDESADA